MGEERNTERKPRPDIVCLEGNGSRPSHQGIGFKMGVCPHDNCRRVFGFDLYNQSLTGNKAMVMSGTRHDHVPYVIIYGEDD